MNVFTEFRDDQGAVEVESQGAYNGDRLPRSGGFRRPMFSTGKRRWMLELDNGEPADQEWVNKRVKECRFYHEYGPKKGELIIEGDLGNMLDPFFNHSELDFRQEEGVFVFDPENPVHQILIAAERARKDDTATKAGGAQKSQVRNLLIEGPQGDSGITAKMVNKKKKAYQMFANMSLEKKKLMIKVLKNMTFSKDPSESALDVEIETYLDDSTKMGPNGKSHIDNFIYHGEMDSDRLETLEKVKRALRLSKIKRANKVYHFSGKPIGGSEQSLLDFFYATKNAEDYHKLLIAIGDEID